MSVCGCLRGWVGLASGFFCLHSFSLCAFGLRVGDGSALEEVHSLAGARQVLA